MRDELAIERLSCARDRQWSLRSPAGDAFGGMYDTEDYRADDRTGDERENHDLFASLFRL